jgi:hypothetical protein
MRAMPKPKKPKREEIKITLADDEKAMLMNLMHVWNLHAKGTVCRKLIVDSLKQKQQSGLIPMSKEQAE